MSAKCPLHLDGILPSWLHQPTKLFCYNFSSTFLVNLKIRAFATIMCRINELSWSFNNKFSTTRYMKVKRTGITEILRRIWLFSANKIKKSPNHLVNNQLNSSFRHIIVTHLWWNVACFYLMTINQIMLFLIAISISKFCFYNYKETYFWPIFLTTPRPQISSI